MSSSAPTPSVPPLGPVLQSLLEAGLQAGNLISDMGSGLRGPNTWLVILKSGFLARPASLPDGVTYREINDPHWWKADYFDAASRNCLACRS